MGASCSFVARRSGAVVPQPLLSVAQGCTGLPHPPQLAAWSACCHCWCLYCFLDTGEGRRLAHCLCQQGVGPVLSRATLNTLSHRHAAGARVGSSLLGQGNSETFSTHQKSSSVALHSTAPTCVRACCLSAQRFAPSASSGFVCEVISDGFLKPRGLHVRRTALAPSDVFWAPQSNRLCCIIYQGCPSAPTTPATPAARMEGRPVSQSATATFCCVHRWRGTCWRGGAVWHQSDALSTREDRLH
jgi:hypothetical protein